MKTPAAIKDKPLIFYGAVLLAALSLAWSAYSITDLMNSGPYGLTVALAGDIGWITVLWAEAHGVTIAGRTWPAMVAGWLIAVGVGVLLAVHGAAAPEHATAQAIAGPFVVLVGKIVWAFALAAMKDPAALTAEQESEIHGVMRDSEYQARMHHAELSGIERAADAEIARIKAEARTVLARDDADFEIGLERVRKRGEIQRRTPLALPVSAPPDTQDKIPDARPDTSGHPDDGPDTDPRAAALSSQDTRPDTTDTLQQIASAASGPAELVRTLSAHGIPPGRLVSEAIRLRPDMVPDSIRRTAKRLGEGPYL